MLYNGNRLTDAMFQEVTAEYEVQPIRIYNEEGHFIGIYEYDNERKDYKPVKLFLEE